MIEHMQVTAESDPEYWASMLRKYVHILDKGLNRPDFELGHSRQCYEAAINAFGKIRPPYDSDPSVMWARKKVAEYEQRQINPVSPGVSEIKPNSEDDYNTLMRLIRGRRSVRTYAARAVEIDKLKTIVEAVNWSPSSCNRQPAKVFIAANPSLAVECAKTCAGATCFSGEACFVSFCADMRVYNLPEEFLLPNLDIGLGIQNCLLVAHTLGISMTLLSWSQHTHEEDGKLRLLLGIPPHCRVIVNALSGYPALEAEPPARKGLEQTLVCGQQPN